MKLRYKDQSFFGSRGNNVKMATGVIMLCFAWDLLHYRKVWGFPIEVVGIFVVCGAVLFAAGVIGAQKTASRNRRDLEKAVEGKAVTEGIIVEAGAYVNTEYKRKPMARRTSLGDKNVYLNLERWAVIEFQDEIRGIPARIKVSGLNRSARPFRNRKVDIYYDEKRSIVKF